MTRSTRSAPGLNAVGHPINPASSGQSSLVKPGPIKKRGGLGQFPQSYGRFLRIQRMRYAWDEAVFSVKICRNWKTGDALERPMLVPSYAVGGAEPIRWPVGIS